MDVRFAGSVYYVSYRAGTACLWHASKTSGPQEPRFCTWGWGQGRRQGSAATTEYTTSRESRVCGCCRVSGVSSDTRRVTQDTRHRICNQCPDNCSLCPNIFWSPVQHAWDACAQTRVAIATAPKPATNTGIRSAATATVLQLQLLPESLGLRSLRALENPWALWESVQSMSSVRERWAFLSLKGTSKSGRLAGPGLISIFNTTLKQGHRRPDWEFR